MEEIKPTEEPLTVERIMELARTIPPLSMLAERRNYFAAIERMITRLATHGRIDGNPLFSVENTAKVFEDALRATKEPQLEWHAVEDGLPAIGPAVLVTFTGATGCSCYAWIDSEIEGQLFWHVVSPDDGAIWKSDGSDGYRVTHWAQIPKNALGNQWLARPMSALPEPPKEE